MRIALALVIMTALAALAAQEPKTQEKTPAKADSKTATKADPKAASKKDAPAPAEASKPPVPPPPPKERREANYGYDLQGRPVAGSPAARENRQGTGAGSVVDRQETLRGHDGRPVAWKDSRERVLAESENERASERVIQRYDPTGRPTSKQIVRVERRKAPDGSFTTTETTFEQDLNGRMQFAERRTTTEQKTQTGGSATVLLERPGIRGQAQVVERVDRVETKRSDTVTEAVSSRKFPDANGRFEERERELSVATKAGSTTTTETRQWRVGAQGVTGQTNLVSRSLSRLTESPDGSQVEDVDVYTTLIAGTTADINRPQVPSLEQQVRREKKVQPDGKIVETTSTRQRQVAEPTRLGGLTVEEQTTTPTADGKTIQKTTYERDSNGKLQRVASSVEEQKK